LDKWFVICCFIYLVSCSAQHSYWLSLAHGRKEFQRERLLKCYSDYLEGDSPYLTTYIISDMLNANGNVRFLLGKIKARVKYLSKVECLKEDISKRCDLSRGGINPESYEKNFLEGVMTLYEYFSEGKKDLVKVFIKTEIKKRKVKPVEKAEKTSSLKKLSKNPLDLKQTYSIVEKTLKKDPFFLKYFTHNLRSRSMSLNSKNGTGGITLLEKNKEVRQESEENKIKEEKEKQMKIKKKRKIFDEDEDSTFVMRPKLDKRKKVRIEDEPDKTKNEKKNASPTDNSRECDDNNKLDKKEKTKNEKIAQYRNKVVNDPALSCYYMPYPHTFPRIPYIPYGGFPFFTNQQGISHSYPMFTSSELQNNEKKTLHEKEDSLLLTKKRDSTFPSPINVNQKCGFCSPFPSSLPSPKTNKSNENPLQFPSNPHYNLISFLPFMNPKNQYTQLVSVEKQRNPDSTNIHFNFVNSNIPLNIVQTSQNIFPHFGSNAEFPKSVGIVTPTVMTDLPVSPKLKISQNIQLIPSSLQRDDTENEKMSDEKKNENEKKGSIKENKKQNDNNANKRAQKSSNKKKDFTELDFFSQFFLSISDSVVEKIMDVIKNRNGMRKAKKADNESSKNPFEQQIRSFLGNNYDSVGGFPKFRSQVLANDVKAMEKMNKKKIPLNKTQKNPSLKSVAKQSDLKQRLQSMLKLLKNLISSPSKNEGIILLI
jgi:hypothetical protein